MNLKTLAMLLLVPLAITIGLVVAFPGGWGVLFALVAALLYYLILTVGASAGWGRRRRKYPPSN